jgi:Tfp pilus assembly protein PilF
MSRIPAFLVFCILCLCSPSGALSGEVAPGFSIEPRNYDVPINEQPFFGFATKEQFQIDADRKFAESMEQRGGRKAAAKEVIAAGWQFLFERGDTETATKRFNQAWLLDRGQSQIAHGFALIVFQRFGDVNHAIELMVLAGKLENPAPPLLADHGQFLIFAKRPKEAIPLLQKAIEQAPNIARPRFHLARAYADDGQSDLACETLKAIPAENVARFENDNTAIRRIAKCK